MFAQFAGGDRTSENPYQITNIEELQTVNQDLNAYNLIMNDINISVTITWNSGEGFESIGNNDSRFTGTGYIIDSLFYR